MYNPEKSEWRKAKEQHTIKATELAAEISADLASGVSVDRRFPELYREMYPLFFNDLPKPVKNEERGEWDDGEEDPEYLKLVALLKTPPEDLTPEQKREMLSLYPVFYCYFGIKEV